MLLSTSIGLRAGLRRALSAGPVPPTAVGLLPDLALERDTAMTPADLSGDFTGAALSFALAPGSDSLPAGLSLSAGGVLSGTPTADAGPLDIIVRATNAFGGADSSFALTVQEMLLDFTATITGLTANPTYGPSALTGTTLTADASGFSAGTPGTVAYQWATVESGDIAGATAATYTPDAALFDGERLFCTITPAGYPSKNTGTAVIRYAPPVASGQPVEQFWDVGIGVQSIDMSAFVTGATLNWSVVAQGGSIDAATGLLSLRTDSQAIGATATVTARNSGGAVTVAFSFHIEDPGIGPGPDLDPLFLDAATNTFGVTVDEESTIYWRRDAVGTNPDPSEVIAGGGLDTGSFAVTTGFNPVAVTFAQGNDGEQDLSVVAVSNAGEPSLVRLATIVIDTAAPVLSASVPADGATGVEATVTPALTFDGPVAAGSGTVTLYDVTADAAVDIFDVIADAGAGSGQVSVSGDTLTLRPSVPLTGGRTYAVLADPGAVRDLAGNDFAGIASTGDLSFTASTATVLDTDFGTTFPTLHGDIWASMQANDFNATVEHRPSETWAAYPASVSDGGIVAVKSDNFPQIRFAVAVEVGKTYTIDADFPLGEGTWAGPLRVKLGSAINLSDYTQIDESEAGQPRVVEMRDFTLTATTTDLWFAVIVETNGGGGSGGNPALSMLRIREV